MSDLFGRLAAALITLVSLCSGFAWLWKRSAEQAEGRRKARWQAFTAVRSELAEAADSACIVAGLRAADCELAPQPLIRDTVAKELCGRYGRSYGRLHTQLMMEQEGSGKSSQAAARARLLDDELAFMLASAAHEEPDAGAVQVVSLGCGMDTRPWRLRRGGSSRGAGGVKLRWFEVDHPAVIELKQQLLKDAGVDAAPPQGTKPGKDKAAASRRQEAAVLAVDELQRVACDWVDGGALSRALEEAGFSRCVRTIWVAEGVLYRLPLGRVSSLLRECSRMSAPGSRLLATLVSSECCKVSQADGAAAQAAPPLLPCFHHCAEELLGPGQLGSLGWEGALLPGDLSELCRVRYKAECYPYFGRFSSPSAAARLTDVEHVLAATRC